MQKVSQTLKGSSKNLFCNTITLIINSKPKNIKVITKISEFESYSNWVFCTSRIKTSVFKQMQDIMNRLNASLSITLLQRIWKFVEFSSSRCSSGQIMFERRDFGFRNALVLSVTWTLSFWMMQSSIGSWSSSNTLSPSVSSSVSKKSYFFGSLIFYV